MDRLSDFTGFDKQAFLSQLSSKNPGDLISESQEFRAYELSNFESPLQEVESKVESLEQNNSELESQLQQIKGNAAEGTEVRESQTVELVIGQEIEDAIRNGNGITGRFMNSATGLYNTVTNADNVQRGLAAVILGLLLTAAILYREW
ncbi:hypothetical protein HRED_07831 [Candidatus Haloredivivus sp. G17]|nr:hypothetical protein HRED_07831 [Candidatus Haloredivivus sp. G17]